MSTATHPDAQEETMVDVQGLQTATVEYTPTDDLCAQPGQKAGPKTPAGYDDEKVPVHHDIDSKAWYDEDGDFIHVVDAAADSATTNDGSSAVLVESSKAVTAMELDRAMTFYQINLPLDASFRDLKMGDGQVAIHEHEKAAVFMNYLRYRPGLATLYDLVQADDYDLINWSEFQIDTKNIYTIDRVYLEITWAVNQLRRKYYQHDF